MRRFAISAWVVVVAGFSLATVVAADEPLHDRIDKLIANQSGGPMSATSSDAEFVRRAYLDFAGQIPTANEGREFLNDLAENKRERLIDRLLADERYADRMTDLFNVMLLERRGEHAEWLAFLRSSFAANEPWDQMAREILNPDAESEATRGAAYFYTVRLERYGQNPADIEGLVRDIGRMFLGVDLQCAQCHDHLFVDDYKQADYQGLFAFVGNTFIRQDKSFPAVGESPLLEPVAFKSVFEGIEMRTGPRFPGGAEVAIPEIAKGEEYLVPPDKKERTPGVLRFSPLRTLGESLPNSANRAFARNIVNRLWWALMGRGLVDPLDLHHADNPPSHPELLELLTDEFTAHKFDLKWLVRELALTETYQRSGILPLDVNGDVAPASYRTALERPLSSQQFLRSLLVATGHQDVGDEKLTELQKRFDRALANPPKEPELRVNPTVQAALFLSNDEQVLSLFQAGDGNLVQRLVAIDDPAPLADELYLSVLTRLPTDDERIEVARYLAESTEPRETAVGELAWALAASTEFFVNH